MTFELDIVWFILSKQKLGSDICMEQNINYPVITFKNKSYSNS